MGEVHPGWGHLPRPSSEVATVVLSNGVKIPVQKRLTELIKTLGEATLAKGYPIRNGATWGYAVRKIRGGKSWSAHSGGTAVDINSDTNPMGRRLVTDMPEWLPEMWEDCGFRWGGRWKSRPDAMHFSYVGGPEHVAADLAHAKGYLSGAGAPPVPPRPTVLVPGLYHPPLVLRPYVAHYVPPEGGVVLVADNGDTYAFAGAGYPGPQPGRREHDPVQLEPIVDAQRFGPGVRLLAQSGAVYDYGIPPAGGGTNGKPYWGDRKAARLVIEPDNIHYQIVATSGEGYGPVF